MNLGSLEAPKGARKRRKRLGRGTGSGHGKTSTKGHKGQKARAGGYHKRGFEGGQMPLTRRTPKQGFVNIFSTKHAVVNLGDLSGLPQGTVVDESLLRSQGFVKNVRDGVKILGGGEIKTALIFKVSHLRESAKKKIEAAGGRIEMSPAQAPQVKD
jgi:large subunit ribosomal protein L15